MHVHACMYPCMYMHAFMHTRIHAYIIGWFTIDVLSIVPSAFDIIPVANGEDRSEVSSGDSLLRVMRIVRAFRLVKLVRLVRASRVGQD